jgi:lipoprotein-anchoring transpeptidase ErfK/SrfK
MLKPFPIFLLLCVLLVSGCETMPRFGFRGPATGPARIVIDLSDQQATLFRGRTAVFHSHVSTGREGYNTPAGSYRVEQKDLDHRSTIYGAYCLPNRRIVVPDVDLRKTKKPPGTVFIGAPMPYFLRIHGAVGMHAGHVPGYPASHGCIRLPNGAAKRFYNAAVVGTPVLIKR